MLPNPDAYGSWQEYARALNQLLDETGVGSLLAIGGSSGGGGGGPATSITMPNGYSMVWLSQADAELFLGNPQFDPPQAADLFTIDTQNIAEAAISTQKLADGAVDFYKLFDGAVGSQKLANLAVTTAKIADLAVGAAKILDATIVTAKIADAAIVSALIGDAQIVSAKIADLAVNNAHIANLAVTGAKIANASIGAAHIIDAQIVNAKIANVIQSYGWDGTNGWRISKDGTIEGTNIVIRNTDGSIAFASGSKVNLATQVAGFLDLANTIGNLDYARTTGFGSFAGLSMLTSGNISTYIAGAAITNAYIANAAIKTANIDDAAISRAKIALAAIGTAQIEDAAIVRAKIGTAAIGSAQIEDAAISSAKIGDAQITSAKIGLLQVKSAQIDDLTVGTTKITDFAVTESGTVLGGGSTVPNNSSAEGVSITFTSTGKPLLILASVVSFRNNSSNVNTTINLKYRTAGGVEGILASAPRGQITSTAPPNVLLATTTPAAGVLTLFLQYEVTDGSGSMVFQTEQLVFLELKK